MTIEVVPGTVALATYVAAHARDEERIEHEALFGPDLYSTVGSISTLDGNYVLMEDGRPTFAFGAVAFPTHTHIAQIWGVGTDKLTPRGLATMTKFIREKLIPDLRAGPVIRAEVRVLSHNHQTMRWLKKLGARKETILRNYGRNGERFVQLAWI